MAGIKETKGTIRGDHMSEYEEEKEREDKGDQEKKKGDVDRLIMAMHTAEIARPSSSLWDSDKTNQTTELFFGEDQIFAELDKVESLFGLGLLHDINAEFYENRRSIERKMLDALLYGGNY